MQGQSFYDLIDPNISITHAVALIKVGPRYIMFCHLIIGLIKHSVPTWPQLFFIIKTCIGGLNINALNIFLKK